MKIEIEINPFNDKWCGVNCKWQLTWGFGRYFGCRLFSDELGGRNSGLKIDSGGCVERHIECLKAEEDRPFHPLI